ESAPREQPDLGGNDRVIAFNLAYGPTGPNPVIEQYTNAGLAARDTSEPIPQASAVPGENASITASAAAIRSLTRLTPSSVRRSATTLSLPLFHTRNPDASWIRTR